MVVPKINSAHGSETRNIINAAIDSINTQGKSIQDLVAEGQLTPEQYAELIEKVNSNVQKGDISIFDINKNYGKIDQSFLSLGLLEQIAGTSPILSEVADGSVTTKKHADKAVTLPKIYSPFGILPKSTVFSMEENNSTRLLSAPVFLNAGDKIVMTDSNMSMSVYYEYNVGGEIIPSHISGWVKEFVAEESRNHTIRARLDDNSIIRDRTDYFASRIYIDNKEVALKKSEFAQSFNERFSALQSAPELELVSGTIKGTDGTFSAVQSNVVSVVHMSMKPNEYVRLKNTTDFEMALWIQGSNTFHDGWNSTEYVAQTDTIISFMVRRANNLRLDIEDARPQIEYSTGNEFARKSDLFNIEGGSNSNNMLYPSYPVWGHEYLYSWYEKLRTNQAVKMTWAGDSTTNGSDVVTGFKRHELGKKIMTLGGYDETLVTTINAGHGSQHTGNWLGGIKDEDKRTPNGFLDEDMQGNPDLYVFAYGFNDGSNSHFPSLSWQERIDRFEENLIEGLERIRGAQYNKSPDDMAIILCTPIAAYDSGRGNTPPVWNDKIRPIIQKACRDYNCAFVDITARQYDHEFSSSWSTNGDMVHPTATTNADYMSMFEPLIFPRLLQN